MASRSPRTAAAGRARGPVSAAVHGVPARRRTAAAATEAVAGARRRTATTSSWPCTSATNCTTAASPAWPRPRVGPGPAARPGRAGAPLPDRAARRTPRSTTRRRRARRAPRRAGRRHRSVSHFLRNRGRAVAGARVRGPALAVPPQGGRPARLGAAPAVGPGQGGDGRGRVRRVRRRPRRPRPRPPLRRPDDRPGPGHRRTAATWTRPARRCSPR